MKSIVLPLGNIPVLLIPSGTSVAVRSAFRLISGSDHVWVSNPPSISSLPNPYLQISEYRYLWISHLCTRQLVYSTVFCAKTPDPRGPHCQTTTQPLVLRSARRKKRINDRIFTFIGKWSFIFVALWPRFSGDSFGLLYAGINTGMNRSSGR
jgi:hypothetical protein